MTSSLQLYRTLFERLRQFLPNQHIARVRVLALLMAGMQASRSVSFGRIVMHWPFALQDFGFRSRVNRVHRFHVNPHIIPADFYAPVARHLLAQNRGVLVRLVMDATKLGLRGDKGCRALTISYCYRGRTLPLAHAVLAGARGQVEFALQKLLLEYIVPLLPPATPVLLVADAGFEAIELLEWLHAQKWQYVLRRNGKNLFRQHNPNLNICTDEHGFIRLDAIPVQKGELLYLGAVDLTRSNPVSCYLTVYWQEGEDSPWLLVATDPNPQQMIRNYRLRMWVEEMYKDLKSAGFNLEKTHLTHKDRIEHLLLVVFLTYLFCTAMGSWVVKNGLRRFIDAKSRRDKSYFRIGYDYIVNNLAIGLTVHVRFKLYLSN